MARKVYSSEDDYLLRAHGGIFAWALKISELAKNWPNYTQAVGEQAQADVVKRVVETAKTIDKNNGNDIVIDAEEATRA